MIGFPILAAVFLLIVHWKTGNWPMWPVWLAAGGLVAGGLCWLLPAAARPFYLVWYALACCVGIIVSNLVVAAIYFGVLTPVGLLLRFVGKDPMERRWQPEAPTYWKAVEPSEDSRRYFQQY